MTRKKDKLLDKFVKKDYNNKLEEVLVKKTYQEEVKNLLLDILYKVETSYKDYETVKRNVLPKEEYIETIISIVKNDCDYIKFIRPENKSEENLVVDKGNKEIVCYPIARKLLYCLAKIRKSEDIIKVETDLLNKTLTKLINVGNNINMVEPLRDFNGFSWNIAVLEIENFYYNLIYQDLIILVGNKILEEWANKHDDMVDYMELFEEDLEKKYEKKIAKDILELLKTISVFLELIVNDSCKDEIIKQKEEKEIELQKMENKEKYIEDLCSKKKDIIGKIKNIDIILNDKEILAKEYAKRNENLALEQKIFSKRILTIKLEQEREELMSQMQSCNELMKTKNFLERKKKLKYELKYLKLIETEDLKKELFEKIVLLQKQVLQALKMKIKKTTDKEKLIQILYEIRYFNLIPIDDNQKIGQVSKLKRMLNIVKNEAIAKAYELKIINEFFKNISSNIDIVEYIFSLDIIKLEDIYVKLIKEKDGMYIQFFDDNIIDEKFKIEFEVEKQDLKVKLNKKVKLFMY